jgi:hypothetical protein
MFKKQDEVIGVGNLPQPETGAPLPVLVSDEHNLYCAYYLGDWPDDWDGKTVRMMDIDTDDEIVTIVRFYHFLVYQFGPPNDEAFHGHPLYKKGLRPYGAFEIVNSSWIDKFEKMNSVHPNHRKERFYSYKHIVLSFHDTTLEVVCKGYGFEILNGSVRKAISIMQDRLG